MQRQDGRCLCTGHARNSPDSTCWQPRSAGKDRGILLGSAHSRLCYTYLVGSAGDAGGGTNPGRSSFGAKIGLIKHEARQGRPCFTKKSFCYCSTRRFPAVRLPYQSRCSGERVVYAVPRSAECIMYERAVLCPRPPSRRYAGLAKNLPWRRRRHGSAGKRNAGISRVAVGVRWRRVRCTRLADPLRCRCPLICV